LDYAASAVSNPSSIHELGVITRRKLENARRHVAEVLFARPGEIIFTSGGTESNNLAIQGVVYAASFLPHIITTNIEHPSVLETFKLLEKRKLAQITIVPVEKNGIVDPRKIKKEIKKNTVLVSVMYANNEIGTIQPIKEIAKTVRYFRKSVKVKPSREGLTFTGYPLFHTDAVQAANYLDLNVEKLGVDLLTLSGSKIEGAGRVGVLYKKKPVPLAPIFGGGDQEQSIRPGTENWPEILKFASALQAAQKIKNKEAKRLTKLCDYFIERLRGTSASLIINGDLENRLPNNVNVTFPKIPSDLLVLELSARGIMCSSKSACESSREEGSYVIEALRNTSARQPARPAGGDLAENVGGVRFSLGRDTQKQDIDYTVKVLAQILQKLKKWYN